jgi:ATP-dependent DNA ligase
MGTLSLRRLWTIYKRTAVDPRSGKRDLARTQLAFYSGARGVLKVLAYLIEHGDYEELHERSNGTDDRLGGSGAASADETSLTPIARRAPAFVTAMAALVVKKLPAGDEWLYEVRWDGYRASLIRLS